MVSGNGLDKCQVGVRVKGRICGRVVAGQDSLGWLVEAHDQVQAIVVSGSDDEIGKPPVPLFRRGLYYDYLIY